MPLAGYLAGQSYEITVDWSDKLEHVAAAAEITDMQGRRAGRVRLPGQEELKDPELCEDQPKRAGRLLLVAPPSEPDACSGDPSELSEDCRAVVHSTSCGAQRLRFLWTAPRASGPLWFAGVLVSGDGDGTSDADGVNELGSVIADRSSARTLEVTSGCSAAPHPVEQRSRHTLWMAACVLGLVRSRRKRHERYSKIGRC